MGGGPAVGGPAMLSLGSGGLVGSHILCHAQGGDHPTHLALPPSSESLFPAYPPVVLWDSGSGPTRPSLIPPRPSQVLVPTALGIKLILCPFLGFDTSSSHSPPTLLGITCSRELSLNPTPTPVTGTLSSGGSQHPRLPQHRMSPCVVSCLFLMSLVNLWTP